MVSQLAQAERDTPAFARIDLAADEDTHGVLSHTTRTRGYGVVPSVRSGAVLSHLSVGAANDLDHAIADAEQRGCRHTSKRPPSAM